MSKKLAKIFSLRKATISQNQLTLEILQDLRKEFPEEHQQSLELQNFLQIGIKSHFSAIVARIDLTRQHTLNPRSVLAASNRNLVNLMNILWNGIQTRHTSCTLQGNVEGAQSTQEALIIVLPNGLNQFKNLRYDNKLLRLTELFEHSACTGLLHTIREARVLHIYEALKVECQVFGKLLWRRNNPATCLSDVQHLEKIARTSFYNVVGEVIGLVVRGSPLANLLLDEIILQDEAYSKKLSQQRKAKKIAKKRKEEITNEGA